MIQDIVMPDSNVAVQEAPTSLLWRYMDFAKFVSLLEKRALFFARADKLGDPFEGSFPKKNIAARFASPHFSLEEKSKYAFVMEQLRRFTLINCWHESNHESVAMWELYSSAQRGIAVKTDFDSIKRSFSADQQIHIERVRYVDYDNDLIPEDDPLSPYLHKRKSFEHEREVRAIVQDLPPGINFSELRTSPRNIEGILSQQWQDIHDIGTGTYCEVDLNRLIKEVIVDPSAPDWFQELVSAVAERYQLASPIVPSSLTASPAF